jgi:hypothetical protein
MLIRGLIACPVCHSLARPCPLSFPRHSVQEVAGPEEVEAEIEAGSRSSMCFDLGHGGGHLDGLWVPRNNVEAVDGHSDGLIKLCI